MNRDVSIFLDLTRVLAAYLVFLSHSAAAVYSGGLLWQISGLGREAVDVFFVLSGFVIAHVTSTGEPHARDYAVNRIARVLSVALPALALTWLLDRIGTTMRPSVYSGFCCEPDTAWIAYLRNLFFLGDIWSQNLIPGSNRPYWSLGYEVWYYITFGLLTFLPRRLALPAAALALAVAGPGIAILFPLWLLGNTCYRQTVPPRYGAPLMALGLLGALGVATFGMRQGDIYNPFTLQPGRLLDYAHDYAMGLAFAAILTGFRAIAPRVAAPLRAIERPIRWLAGGTFALYLFHVPLLRFLAAILPLRPASWPMWITIHTTVPLACFALAELTERRKSWWRAAVDRLIPGKPQ